MTITHFDQLQLAERWGLSPKTRIQHNERILWTTVNGKHLVLDGRELQARVNSSIT